MYRGHRGGRTSDTFYYYGVLNSGILAASPNNTPYNHCFLRRSPRDSPQNIADVTLTD